MTGNPDCTHHSPANSSQEPWFDNGGLTFTLQRSMAVTSLCRRGCQTKVANNTKTHTAQGPACRVSASIRPTRPSALRQQQPQSMRGQKNLQQGSKGKHTCAAEHSCGKSLSLLAGAEPAPRLPATAPHEGEEHTQTQQQHLALSLARKCPHCGFSIAYIFCKHQGAYTTTHASR